ncbi:MAG: glycosyltransferase family 2 protein [Brevinema sp.]
MLLSVVIPCYNEQEVLEISLNTLMKDLADAKIEDYEVICVNDGSKDKTLDILKDYSARFPKIKYVSLARNSGQQIAFYAGMCYSSGDTVVLIDADLQDPPYLIPAMLEKWREGNHVVYAVRMTRAGENIFKRFSAFLFYRLLNLFSYTDIPKDVGEFRLMDRAVVDAVVQIGEHQRFNRALVNWLGFKQCALPFERPERAAGETKFGMKEMLNLAKDGLFSFSHFPIHFVQFCGVASMFIAFAVLCYALVSYFLGYATAGWSSLIIIISFFSGLMLFCIGLLGEYIIRIHTQVLHRPIFIAQETNNLSGKELPDHIARFHSKRNQLLK